MHLSKKACFILFVFWCFGNTHLYAAVSPPAPGGGEKAAPKPGYVWVVTKKVGDKVVISVKDNGAGIPQKILGKIFQPFFTTRPTGQGTGLGLSLCYDIVKAHGGELSCGNQGRRRIGV